jgi:hypothetical protein
MNNPKEEQSTITDISEDPNLPFVNEECGDTMWNVVLQEAEERLKKAATTSPDTGATEMPGKTGNNRDAGN